MVTQVTIAPGHWLDAAAAASWARMRAAGMPTGGITEAGRTRARQTYLYGEYLAGRLLAYAARPGESLHESGLAIDMKTASAAHAWLVKHGADHGWHRPLLHAKKPEPWHHEYRASRDQHLTDAAAPVAPLEPTAPRAPQEDPTMIVISAPLPWDPSTRQYAWITDAAGAGSMTDLETVLMQQVVPRTVDLDTWDAYRWHIDAAWTRNGYVRGLSGDELRRHVEDGVRAVIGTTPA